MEPDIEPSTSLQACSIGILTSLECHKTSYAKHKELNDIHNLCDSEKELLLLRASAFIKRKISDNHLINICEHHKIWFLMKYEFYQYKCADPFQRHKKQVKKSIRVVSRDLSNRLFSSNILVAPGQKLCYSCTKLSETNSNAVHVNEPAIISDSDSPEYDTSLSKDEALNSLNSSLRELGKSPLTLHGIPSYSKKSYAKRKVKAAYDTLKSKVQRVTDVDLSPERACSENIQDIKQKAEDFDELMNMLKEKVKLAGNRREQLQLLTLVPNSWSKNKIIDEFEVTDYAVRQSRQLLRERGILAMPDIRKGKPTSPEIIELIEKFYESDDYSRIMPGKKDVVSITKNVHEQKRLILCNLRELYSLFKQEYPHVNVKFSKFCSLRPKWCILAGSSGTHSVCVCMKHQNTILLLHAAHITENYHVLIKQLVCSVDSRDCMLRHCPNCPTNENLRKYLEEKFEDYNSSDSIQYQQWISTDRTEMVTCTVPLDEFVEILIKSLENLIPHSFITKAQSNFLKETKAHLGPEEAIILLDFSENFTFVIQDEVQSYHWTKEACTIHPVVIYTQSPGNKLSASNLCILSDDMKHDVTFVYVTQKEAISFIKEKFPDVKKIFYFSDGCSGQYKNCKNFINLCHHEEDFTLQAKWSFFATSHGKSPCDGIGGTVKRIITKESLQRCFKDPINSVQKIFDFCNDNLSNIHFRLLLKQNIQNERKNLQDRFSKAKTIPGTRGFHQFIPLSKDCIGAKRISNDKQYSYVYNFNREPNPPIVSMFHLALQSYVACMYDEHWFFGMVLKINEDENEVTINFMHPPGPSKSFYWPSANSPNREDICEVPLHNIICTVNVPSTKDCGQTWYFDENEIKFIQNQFNKMYSKAI